jgi:outer membrane autotransporter protein
MSHTRFPSLSHLAFLPPLLWVASSASAQTVIRCFPTATPAVVRPGETFTLQGNCVNQNTGATLTSGTEAWLREANGVGGGWVALGTRDIAEGTLTVTAPATEGRYMYGLESVDPGYGGPITDLGGEGPLPVFVEVRAAATGPGSQSSAAQLSAPLLALQGQRVRNQLNRAEARLRELRKARSQPKREREGSSEERTSFYVGGLLDYLRQKSDPNAFNARTTQLSVGGDHRFGDSWVAGGSIGRSEGRVSFAQSASRQESTGTNLTTYASYSLTPTSYLTATLSYEATRFDVTRDEQGTLTTSAPRGRGIGLSLSAGRDYVFGPWTVAPYVRFDNVNSQVDAFNEAGGATAVAVSAQRLRSNSLNVGAQTQFAVPTSWGIVLPFVRAELTQRRDGVRQAAQATLLDDNSAVLVPVSPDTRDGFGTVGFGVSGVHTEGLSWFADYETAVGQKGYRSRRLGFGLRSEF